MKKVIITGFEPFGPHQHNPTADLAEYFNGKTVANRQVIGAVLPATYLGAFDVLKKLIQDHDPSCIISFGLASRVQGIRIETKFKNLMCGKYPDGNSFFPFEEKIIDKGEEFLFSNGLLNGLIFYQLKKIGLPVELSCDAEGFICNSLGYLTSKMISEENSKSETQKRKNMFLHIPWTDDYKSKVQLDSGKIYLPIESLHSATENIIRHCY